MTSFEAAGLDETATRIGSLYRAAIVSARDSMDCFIACGRELIAAKAALPHGDWMLWLKARQSDLGFESSTARRLMALASNCASTHDLADAEVLALSRKVWANDSDTADSPDSATSWVGFARFLKWADAHSPAVLAIADPAAVYAQIALARQWLERLETSIAAVKRAA